jgi:hypothetical protein
MKQMLRRQNSAAISLQVSPASLLGVSEGNCKRALVDESEMFRNQIGTHNRSEMVAVQGHLVGQSHNNKSMLIYCRCKCFVGFYLHVCYTRINFIAHNLNFRLLR